MARHVLMDSRPHAKKAVFVLTDGKSNIGPPPVKVAFDILSLQWDLNWDEATLGPQVRGGLVCIVLIYGVWMSSLYSRSTILTLTVLVTTIDALQHFETG